MADLRSLVVKNGTTQGITTADTLIVGNKLDAAAGSALTIGGTNATGITVGQASITTSFPGPVELAGDVTTVGGTVFTTDATFEGNVTFGNGPSDTVTFAATTTVIGDIAFNGAGYRITNMLDPTGSSTQEGATAAWVTAQIAAIPATVPGAPANSIQFNDGAGGFGGSANLTWDGSILNVTGSGNIFTLTDAIDGVFLETSSTFYTVSLLDPLGSGARLDLSAVNGVIAQGSEIKLTLATAPSTNRLLSFGNDGSQNPTIKSEITTDGGATFVLDVLRISASEVDVGWAGLTKIVNVADGVNPNDAVNFSQLSAIVSGVSAVSATAPLLSSGGATPDISIDTAGASNGDVLTFNAVTGAWAAAPTNINVGTTFIAVGDGTGLTGNDNLKYAGGELSVYNPDPVIAVTRLGGGGSISILRPESFEFAVTSTFAAFALLKARNEVDSSIPLKLDASELDVDGVKITNLANGTNPGDAVNFSQLSAIVSGVSAVSATAPLLSSGGATPDISIDTAGAAAGDVLTFDGAAWAAAAPVLTPPGGAVSDVQLNDGAGGFSGSSALSFASNTLTVTNTVQVTDGANTLSLTKDAIATDAATLDIEGASSVTATITGGASYLLTPNSVQTGLPTSGAITLDLDPSLTPYKQVGALTGDISFANASNPAAARSITVEILGDTVSRNVTSVPAGWTWLGGAAPTVVPANATVILSIACFGASNNDVVASWSYDGSVNVTDVTASAPLASSGGTTPNISLTGVIAVGNGGTGQSTLTSGALVVGQGASAVSTLSPGSNGQVLTVVAGAWAASSLPAATDYSVVSITTAVAQGDAVTVAGVAAIATAASTSRVAGIVSATANKVSVLGIVEDCNFEGSLTLAVGDAVYLSASSAGKLTNVAPSASGEVVAELGIITVVNAAGGGAAAADVLWQPKSIVVL